jgi:two-component system response regulator AtoC
MSSILIIDDEAALVNSLSFALRGEGYEVVGAGTAADGLKAAERAPPSLILLDLRLPDGSGLEVLERLLVVVPGTPVIMISAHGDTRAAVRSVKAGAFDYLTKPFELDELLLTIRSALERERMSQEIARFREAALAGGELVGESPVVRALAEATRQVGASHAGRVLLLGESGSGKALVARAIHARSSRSGGPFVEVNCAALPAQLIEAELFGAEKGAYTGALQRRVGLAALADGGTLFLDEVGELPLALQAKLLHFLEDGSYRPVGSAQSLVSDARVVAATNRDLAAEVRAGTFREDLYYRLNVVHLSVPPLRDRGNDILLLARHFAQRYARDESCAPVRFTPEAEAVLLAYRWPGNVRELRNLVERLTILSPGKIVSPADLPPVPAPVAPPPAPGPGAPRSIDAELEDSERALVLSALQQAGGHQGRAAAALGISRHALKRRLQRLGLK